jgi:hypothetical protein
MKTDALRFLAGGLAAAVCSTAALGFDFIRNDTTGLPVKWPDGTVGLRILLGTDKTLIDGHNYSTSAQAGAVAWNTQLGSVQFLVTIATPVAPIDHNHVNELAFANDAYGQAFDANTLAVTTAWAAGNQRTEADIIFNSARTWDSYSGNLRPGTVDLYRVAQHEMGHILGLDHPDEAGQSVVALMNSHVSNLDTLAADDVTGAQDLYGPPTPPPNNNFASATVIGSLSATNTVTVTGYNNLATKEPGEPNHAGNAGGHSVWWKWTAPTNGNVALDTRGSYFDTTLGVYTGNSVSTLTTIAANDDITSGQVQASSLNFNATAGTVYYFAVDGFAADDGGISLNLALTATAGTLPTITTQPGSAAVTTGGSALFSVTATAGTSTISYQWQFNGTAISGATSSSYSIGSVTSANAGTYTVVVSTIAGSVTSIGAILTVTTPPPVVAPAPPPSSGGGGGGGGAPSPWFLLALGALAAARWRRR